MRDVTLSEVSEGFRNGEGQAILKGNRPGILTIKRAAGGQRETKGGERRAPFEGQESKKLRKLRGGRNEDEGRGNSLQKK